MQAPSKIMNSQSSPVQPSAGGNSPFNSLTSVHQSLPANSEKLAKYASKVQGDLKRNRAGGVGAGGVKGGKSKHNENKTEWKIIIFIRHGNSIWNNLKNSGKKWRGLAFGITEYIRAKSNMVEHKDTWVVDAPLSRLGYLITQTHTHTHTHAHIRNINLK